MMLATSMFLGLTLGAQIANAGSRPNLMEAHGLQANGKFDQARDLYETVLMRDPSDAEAQLGMAEVSEHLSLTQRATGHMDEALRDLTRAQKVEPVNQRILLDIGILEDEMSLDLDAAATLEKLKSLGATDPNVSYALARVDLSLGRLEAAQSEMQTYLKVRPLDASAHYGLARIDQLGLHFDIAEEEFKTSIELQPKQTEAYYELGEIYLNENKLGESIPEFKKVLERAPQHGGALVGMGEAYFKLKQYDQANEWLVKATQAAPDYQPGHYYLGLTLARIGKANESRKELAVATELAAKDSKQGATRLQIQNAGEKP